MLGYRHGFHAGNAADTFKHAVLVFCLEYLVQKEKPCLFADTHAGAGSYSLAGGFAAQRREWEGGIGRIARAARERPLPALLARYLETAGPTLRAETGTGGAVYPGSPAIMARFLRGGDRLVCFELHPADYGSLAELLAPCRGAEARREDGFKGLAGLLPPPSRRGLVLIDPSYEMKEDFSRVPAVLGDALKRFAGGTYIVWYPLLAGRSAGERPSPAIPSPAGFSGQLSALYRGCRCLAELRTTARDSPPANSPRGMYGSGLAIYNPPWTLRPALEAALPALANLLGGGAGGWDLDWLEG